MTMATLARSPLGASSFAPSLSVSRHRNSTNLQSNCSVASQACIANTVRPTNAERPCARDGLRSFDLRSRTSNTLYLGCHEAHRSALGLDTALHSRSSGKCRSKRRCQCSAVAAQAADTVADAPPLPRTSEEQTALAFEALKRAEADGVKRQRMQLLLPIDARASNFLDTEPRDYPCGIKEEFEVAIKAVTRILQAAGGEVRFRKIGEKDQEMDPVGLVSTADKTVAAVVFPIAETLKQLQELAKNSSDATLALVNPQWTDSGQIVSDFGFGPWKRKAEEFLGTFRPTYELLEQRIGEASNITSTRGGVVRLLRTYPYDWQVFLMSSDGNNECIATHKERPPYAELEKLVEQVRTLRPAKLSTSVPAPPPLARSVAGPFTDDEIDGMDKSELRRALTALGLPTSGRLAVMQDRVKEAQRTFGLVRD